MTAKMFKATVFLMFLVIYGINFADSEPDMCKEIQCPPPEIIENCPTDSILTDKFDLITTLLTTIATTTTTTTQTPTTTITLKTTIPEMITVNFVKETLYDDENSNETDSLEMTDNSIPYQYSTKLNEPIKDDTTNNSISTEINLKQTASLVESSISSTGTDSTSSFNNTTDSTITNNTTDSTITNSTSEKTKKTRKHRKKPIKERKMKSTIEKTDEPTEPNISESTQSEHVLEKRSLRSYQRESIKIVPGGYINYEPQVLHYRQSNHHKWKRSAIPTIKLPTIYQRQICCPKKECTCRENGCIKPICVVLVEIKPGTNIPGKCCPQYECAETEPECLDGSGIGKPYWISECEQYQCMDGIKIYTERCPPAVAPRYCFSNSLQKPIQHGLTWREDDCTTCECVDGDRTCSTVRCKAPNCIKLMKIPGKCCLVCAEDIIPPSTTNSPTLAPQNITLLSNFIPENNTNKSVPIVTTWPSETAEPNSFIRAISDYYIIVILVCFVIGIFIILGLYYLAMWVIKKCKQTVYQPVKKSESTNSSQIQEKPIGLISSNSQ